MTEFALIPWTDVPSGALCEIVSKRRLFVRWPNQAKGTADSVWVPSTTRSPTWAHEPDNTIRGEVQVLAAGLTEKQCEILACSPTAEARLLGPLFAAGNKESIPWVDMPHDSLSLLIISEGSHDVTGYLVLRRRNDAQFVGTKGERAMWPVHNSNPQRGRLFVLAKNLTDEEQAAMTKERTTADVLALRPTRRASRAGQWVAWADVPPGSSVRASDGREFLRRPESELTYEISNGDLRAFPYDRSKDPCGPGSAGVYHIEADNLTSVDCDVVQRTSWLPARWAYLTKRAKVAPRDLPRRCLWQDVAQPDVASRGGITSSSSTAMDSVLSSEGRVYGLYGHVVREMVREVPQALNDKYATGCSLPYVQLLDEVVRAKWGAPDGWASKPEAVAFLANEIAFRACSAVPPDSYETCAEAVRTAVESVLSMPKLIRSLDDVSDGGLLEHGTASRLLASVGIHLWQSGTRCSGWWGTGPRTAATVAELLYQYVREDTGDPVVHATATLGRDHEYEMGLASGRAVKRDARLTGAWQLAEFVGRCRQALLCGDGQYEEEETGWRDGLLSVPGGAEVVTDGPWPVYVCRDNAHPDHWLGLFFNDGASPAATVNLRLANAVALAVYGHDVKMGTSPYHTNLPWVRRCS